MNSKLLRVISVLLTAAVLFALASCGQSSGDEETTTGEIIPVTPAPSNTSDALAYFNRLINGVKSARPGVSMECRRNISDISAVNSKGDVKEVGDLLTIAKKYIKELDKKSDTAEYGDALNNFLPVAGTPFSSQLSEADILSAKCEDSENEPDKYYVLTVVLKDEENPAPGSSISKAFDLDIDKTKVLKEFQGYTNLINVSDYSTLYTDCQIVMTVLKATDEITNIGYEKNVIVTSDVVFNGTLDSWGDATVKLTFHETKEYKDFVWTEPTTAETK
ncbi:MAG: hypothetical protein K6F09_05450 [Clostridiales bacterium]|nr:hypothetical protein [Clostridiales bacterium]